MKVTTITPRNRKSDNKEYWDVKLEGSELPLLMYTKPEFAEGTDLSDSSLQTSANGKYYTFKKASGDKPQSSKQPYGGKHSDKDSEVESSKRCALMQATDIYTHCTDSSIPFDDDYFKRIYKVCSSLIGIDSPLVEEAKKMGAVEK